MKLNFNARVQKIALNVFLFVIITFIEIGILGLNCTIFMSENVGGLYVKVAAIIILGWLGIMLAFYAWAIYFYNVNFGLTNEDWEKIKRVNEESDQLKALGMEPVKEPIEAPSENPYKDETFGLPPGTVRATIAITVLVAGLSMLLVSFDKDAIDHISVHEKYLEFFKTAFLMMIAFYFGTQSLKILKSGNDSTSTSGSTDSDEKKSNKDTSKSSDTSSVNVNEVKAVSDAKVQPVKEVEEKEEEPSHIMKATERNSVSKKITNEDILKCAQELGNIEPALVSAVLTVESSGGGFLQDGRPKILFEGHVFWKNLVKKGIDPKPYALSDPDIVYQKWTKQFYSKTSSGEYTRLDKAIAIDRESALKSASWGLFQILGDNYKAAGFASVEDFVEAQKESEYQQLRSFMNFIKSQDLVKYLVNHDWRGFASRYNGPGYEANQYHLKLEEAYAKHVRLENPSYKTLLKRTIKSEVETLGEFTVMNSGRTIFTCKTLELPWKNNERNVSCIPEGTYKVQKRFNETYQNHFHVMDVKDRSWILIRSGNYYSDLRGCIFVGLQHLDINKDGVFDVTNSRDTLKKLAQILPDEFTLEIS